MSIIIFYLPLDFWGFKYLFNLVKWRENNRSKVKSVPISIRLVTKK